jgi:hypothetical protein
MEVFDLQISDEEFGAALARVYQQELVVQSYDLEVHSELQTRRLAKAEVYVQTEGGVKILELLIKEGSRHELAALSLANKVLPFSSPRIILYKFFPKGVWLVLENISTWVDVNSPERTGERMVDGLYAIHRVFLGGADTLSRNLSIFPVTSEEQLRSSISRTIADIEKLRSNKIVTDLFETWPAVRACIDDCLATLRLNFPTTLLHGSYYPNTVRGLLGSEGRVHVVAYDWQYAAIGWPQIDLALLLDRLDVIAEYQDLQGPSPVLCGRYWMQLCDEHPALDFEQFISVYKFCYIYRALHLIRWWTKSFIGHPTREPGRAVLEVKIKLEKILADNERSSSSEATSSGV